MLGMCPRPFLHNLTSKNQLTQSHEDDTPVLQPPHQIVIGFELDTDSNKSLHAQACESPRSVLEPQHLCFRAHRQQSRSPYSPISALRSSLSDHRRSPAVTGLCLKVSSKAEEDAYHSLLKSDNVACDIVDGVDTCQSGAAAACKLDCARTLQNQQWNSHNHPRDGACQGSHDNPYSKSILSRNCEDDEDEDKDEEIDVDSQTSIFSTASPVSNNPMWDLPAAADFLSKCFLCRRGLLQGKDIYMYRGDRAFCSQECRYQQIVGDEHN